ncbi:MAG: alpha/beta hydrolase [Solirubrobacteraceae bacterium]
MASLVREEVRLGYQEAGQGAPALVFVHGLACHRGFWTDQVDYFSRDHRVLAVDLRGHGDSDAPRQPYTMQALADDVEWMCTALGVERPLVVGHSLGGLVALELAASRPERVAGAVLVDSILLPPGDRAGFVDGMVAQLRGAAGFQALREYYSGFFGPHDDRDRMAWILDEIVHTPLHVTSSILEESVGSWSDADALKRSRDPLLYLDAGTPNADLARAARLRPDLLIGRTVGSGHFSPCEVPEQVNAMLERFLKISLSPPNGSGGARS